MKNHYKILIDENLSDRLTPVLNDNFPGSSHIKSEHLMKNDDIIIWNWAKDKGYCILTKDWDFKFMSSTFGCPPKVIRLNCGNKTTNYIIDLLKQKVSIIQEFLADNDICYMQIQ